MLITVSSYTDRVLFVCVCVCVCVCERERERERECVCVCVCGNFAIYQRAEILTILTISILHTFKLQHPHEGASKANNEGQKRQSRQ